MKLYKIKILKIKYNFFNKKYFLDVEFIKNIIIIET